MKILELIIIANLIFFSSEGIAKIAAIAGCAVWCAVDLVSMPEYNELCFKCMSAANQLSCFSSSSTFILQKNITLPAYEIKIGDSLLTLNKENNGIKYSKVIFKKQIIGKFSFVSIVLENGQKIRVTDEHGIIFLKNHQKFIKNADKVKVGDILITTLGKSKVVKIEKYFEKSKFIVETEDGTVFSNGIYVSTICEEEINETKEFNEIISEWRKIHKNIFDNLNYLSK